MLVLLLFVVVVVVRRRHGFFIYLNILSVMHVPTDDEGSPVFPDGHGHFARSTRRQGVDISAAGVAARCREQVYSRIQYIGATR
jgi:hypothetical protein